MSLPSITATTESTMASSAATMARRAVVGWLIHFKEKMNSSAIGRYFHQSPGKPNGPLTIGVGDTDDDGVVSGELDIVWPPGEVFPSGVTEDVAVADGDAPGDADALGAGDAPSDTDAPGDGGGDADDDGDAPGVGDGRGEGEGLGPGPAATPIFAGLLAPTVLMP